MKGDKIVFSGRPARTQNLPELERLVCAAAAEHLLCEYEKHAFRDTVERQFESHPDGGRQQFALVCSD